MYIYKYFCTFAPNLMSSKPQNRLQNELLRHSAQLLSANVFAQAVGLLVYPLLTRIYTPDDFGLLNLFMSIGGIGIIVATAGYHDAVVLPKDDARSRSLLQVCVACVLVVMAVGLLSIPFSGAISSAFDAPGLAQWWWLMPLYVGSLGLWNGLSNYYLRNKAFRRISTYQMSQSVLNAGSKLGMGACGWLSGGMIISSVIAPLAAIGISLLRGGRKLIAPLFRIDGRAMREVAREYRNFPCYSLPRSLVNILGSNLPVLMLTPVFGLAEMGFFGMALTLAMRPLQVIVQSVYQVLYQRTAQLVNEGRKIGSLLFGFMRRTALVLAPCFALLYAVLPWLTELLLGDSWRVCGEYIRLLLPWLYVMTVVAPVGFVTDVFGKQKIAFGIEIVYTVLRVGALVIGIALRDFRLTLLLYALASAAVIVGQMIWYAVLIRRHDRFVTVS